ncbi:MAG: hypothetical protein GX946_01470 [Oligosphaeraceae bacterium]|nr:hypothetical protein [Oligosphaeraceae bacterium]
MKKLLKSITLFAFGFLLLTSPVFARSDGKSAAKRDSKAATDMRGRRERRNQERSPERPARRTSERNSSGYQHSMRSRVRQLMEDLQANDPKEYERLQKLKRQDRELYFQELWKKMPERENKKRDEINRIEKQCHELAERHRQAPESEKKSIKKELNTKLERSMQLVIEDTEERLRSVESALEHLNANREKIINERLQKFLREDDKAEKETPIKK